MHSRLETDNGQAAAEIAEKRRDLAIVDWNLIPIGLVRRVHGMLADHASIQAALRSTASPVAIFPDQS